MIEFLDLVQGTPEWFEARRGIPTASRFGAILAKGKTRRSYLLELAAERLTGEVRENYVNAAMERGTRLEPEARAYYAFVTGVEVQQVGFVRHTGSFICGCSPDGLVGSSGLVEIKTRSPGLMVEVLASGGVPADYYAQIQGQIWLCDRQWCDLVCYCQGMPVHIARAERDDDYIETLAAAVEEFSDDLNAIVSRVWPAFEEDAA